MVAKQPRLSGNPCLSKTAASLWFDFMTVGRYTNAMPLQEARIPRYVSSPSMGLAPWSRSVLFRRERLLNSLRERGGGDGGSRGCSNPLRFFEMKGVGAT